MATSNTLGAAYIDIVIRGIGKVQADLQQLKTTLKGNSVATGDLDKQTAKAAKQATEATKRYQQLASAVQSVGSFAARSFAIGTASVAAFWRIADPKGADDLQVAFFSLSLQIGRMFVPLMRAATEVIRQVATWLKNLSDETRDSVRWWVAAGLAVAGFLALLPKVISLVSTCASAASVLKVALAALFGATPVGWIAAIVAGLTLLGVTLYKTGQLTQLLTAGWSLIRKAGEAVKPVIASLISVLQALWAGIQPLIGALASLYTSYNLVLIEGFKKVLTFLTPVFKLIAANFSLLAQAIGAGLAFISKTIEAGAAIFAVLWEAAEPVFDALDEAFTVFMEVASEVLAGLSSQLQDWGVNLEAVKEIAVAVFDSLIEGVKNLKPVFETVFRFIAEQIQSTVEKFVYMSKLLQEFKKGNVKGAFAAADEALQDYKAQAAERQQVREQKRDAAKAPKEEKEQPKKPDSDRNKGEIRLPAPQLIGITDLMRNIQTAQSEDVATRLAREQAENSKRGADATESLGAKVDKLIETVKDSSPFTN